MQTETTKAQKCYFHDVQADLIAAYTSPTEQDKPLCSECWNKVDQDMIDKGHDDGKYWQVGATVEWLQ